MKFVWLVYLYLKKLLDRITMPDSLGQYGLEDTFIMWGSEKLRIGQFKIKNLVVCENYKYRDNKHLSIYKSIDRREEFKQIAIKNFPLEIEIFPNLNLNYIYMNYRAELHIPEYYIMEEIRKV